MIPAPTILTATWLALSVVLGLALGRLIRLADSEESSVKSDAAHSGADSSLIHKE